MGPNLFFGSTVSVAMSSDTVFLLGTWQLAGASCLVLTGVGKLGEAVQVIVLVPLDLSL